MSRGTKPTRQILNHWVNQLQRENKALKTAKTQSGAQVSDCDFPAKSCVA